MIIFACIVSLGACSLLPERGPKRETRMVEEEEITVIDVYTSSGRLQCEDDSGNEVEDTKEELEASNIKVFSSECGLLTGKMAPALCGATTLHINIHGIDSSKLSAAESLGYQEITSLTDDLGFQTELCDPE
ncbi:MAG: hypothetical protein ACI8XZ_005409 [Gammaproteobacteria bacterium]|jgi:hypothetical protein